MDLSSATPVPMALQIVTCAGAVRRQQSRDAQHRILPEGERIQEIIIDAPIDHIHPLRTPGGAHVQHLIAHEQILALDQFHAHLLGQEGVFEIGAVVRCPASAPPRWDRRRHPARRCAGSRAAHPDNGPPARSTAARTAPGTAASSCAVLDHVRHARGHAQVVLEHAIGAIVRRGRHRRRQCGRRCRRARRCPAFPGGTAHCRGCVRRARCRLCRMFCSW